MSIPNSASIDKPLDRKSHLEKQLERNRLYRDSLRKTTVPDWFLRRITNEIARVTTVINKIEADLCLLAVAPVADLEAQAAADIAALPPAPSLPRCDRCRQEFALIEMAVYAAGQFCPECDRARAVGSEGGR